MFNVNDNIEEVFGTCLSKICCFDTSDLIAEVELRRKKFPNKNICFEGWKIGHRFHKRTIDFTAILMPIRLPDSRSCVCIDSLTGYM